MEKTTDINYRFEIFHQLRADRLQDALNEFIEHQKNLGAVFEIISISYAIIPMDKEFVHHALVMFKGDIKI